MLAPSKDQPRTMAGEGWKVKRRGVPPSMPTTYTLEAPLLSDVKAMDWPSGERWGLLSTAAVLVMRRASPPSTPTIQTSAAWTKTRWVSFMSGCSSSSVPESCPNRKEVARVKKRVDVNLMVLQDGNRCHLSINAVIKRGHRPAAGWQVVQQQGAQKSAVEITPSGAAATR